MFNKSESESAFSQFFFFWGGGGELVVKGYLKRERERERERERPRRAAVLRKLSQMKQTNSGGKIYPCCRASKVWTTILGTFTYYGSLEIEKLIKIVFWAQIGSSRGIEAGKCDFDSFCFAHSHGKHISRSWRHLGAIIFAQFQRACVKAALEMSFVCHPRAWQKSCQHFEKLCDNAQKVDGLQQPVLE